MKHYVAESETCHGFDVFIDEDGDFHMDSAKGDVGFAFSCEQAVVVLGLLNHFIATGELPE